MVPLTVRPLPPRIPSGRSTASTTTLPRSESKVKRLTPRENRGWAWAKPVRVSSVPKSALSAPPSMAESLASPAESPTREAAHRINTAPTGLSLRPWTAKATTQTSRMTGRSGLSVTSSQGAAARPAARPATTARRQPPTFRASAVSAAARRSPTRRSLRAEDGI